MKILLGIIFTLILSPHCFCQIKSSSFDIVDSSCLFNPQFDSVYTNTIFSQQFKLIIEGLNQKTSLPLKDMVAFENSNNFRETSFGHYYTVSNGILPKVRKYKFGNPIRYRHIECPFLDGYVEYFFIKRTKKITLIMFEWKEFKFKKSDLFAKDTNLKLTRKAFEDKYTYLTKKISEQFGKEMNIEQEKDSGRRDTKWKNANGLSAYLFMFDNYNEIRLAIYKE